MENLNLNAGEVDVAIRLTTEPDELLIGKQLSWIKDISYNAFASKWYLEQVGADAELADYDWIIWHHPRQTLEQSRQYRWVSTKVEHPKIILQTTSISAISSAIRSGMGVGFFSPQMLTRTSDMVAIPDMGYSGTGNYRLWILCHREMRNIERIRRFMQFVYDKLQSRSAANHG